MQLEGPVEYVPLGGLIINLIIVLVILPLRSSVDKLTASDERIASRIHELEVEVARDYVRRGEMTTLLSDISLKLDRIEARLYGRIEQLETTKVDKHP